MDDAAWLELLNRATVRFWEELAAVSPGGRLEKVEDFTATIMPAAPNRSIFNSVFCADTAGLGDALPKLAETYDEAGINAWTVWIPEDDGDAAAELGRAGHELDTKPRLMGMEIADWQEPEPPAGVETREELDMQALGRLNELAYGYPEGDFTGALPEPVPDSHIHFASVDGETVGCGMTWEHDGDAEVTFIATVPEARGRGVAGEIMSACIRTARDRGSKTTTLQASASRSLGLRADRLPRLRRDAHVGAAQVTYSQEEIERALESISDPESFRAAEQAVAESAPQLQAILAQALAAGGWFGESHEAEVLKAATAPDEEERLSAVRTLLAEEARMGMMVGVAVGWALSDELKRKDKED